MIFAALACWLGIGLLVLAGQSRVAVPSSRTNLTNGTPRTVAGLSRLAGALLLVASAALAVRELGLPLGVAGASLVAMAMASVAVLVAPLRPRLYAASLPLAAISAVISAALLP